MLKDVYWQTKGVSLLQRVIDRQLNVPLLLVGPAGTGRRFSVLAAAKEIVKQDESQVYQVATGRHPDITVALPESGKEVKVEAIRALLEKAKFQPSRAPLRFLVVDGIDNATSAAENALLKVLEDAPSLVRFFLLAEREDKVIPTIRSRCAVARYRALPTQFIQEKLRDHTENDARALVCSRLAEGSVGRAIHYLDSGKLSLRDSMLSALSFVPKRDVQSLFSVVESIAEDLPLALRFLEHLLFDMTMLRRDPSLILNTDKTDALVKLGGQLEGKTEQLRSALKVVQALEGSSINLVFHVKTLFISAF